MAAFSPFPPPPPPPTTTTYYPNTVPTSSQRSLGQPVGLNDDQQFHHLQQQQQQQHQAFMLPQQSQQVVYDHGRDSTSSLCTTTSRRNQTKADKRAEHNAIERARREGLNSRFQQLANLLPNLPQNTRPSKGTIIERTLEFVKEAIKKEDRYRHEIKDLRHTNRQLLKQLTHLTASQMAHDEDDQDSIKSAYTLQHPSLSPVGFSLSPATQGSTQHSYSDPTHQHSPDLITNVKKTKQHPMQQTPSSASSISTSSSEMWNPLSVVSSPWFSPSTTLTHASPTSIHPQAASSSLHQLTLQDVCMTPFTLNGTMPKEDQLYYQQGVSDLFGLIHYTQFP